MVGRCGIARQCESKIQECAQSDRSDEKAKGKVFLDYFLKARRRIFAYIYTLLPNAVDAEDVLQEVSKLLWEKFDEGNPPDDFVAWACRIANYKVREHRRSQRRWQCMFSDAMCQRLAATIDEQQSAELFLDQRQEALAGCLAKLAATDRALLTERFREGASVRSVAEAFGRTTDAVYKILARIRERLHDCVERTLLAEEHS
jgi:RNA polymerase sigma-70 factor (ECF subfamily)